MGFFEFFSDKAYKKKMAEKMMNSYKEYENKIDNARTIVNNYGASLVKNDGLIVFKKSTLSNTVEEIESALKTFIEDLVTNGLMDKTMKGQLGHSYASLARFIDDDSANYLNNEFKRMRENKGNDEKDKEIMQKIMSFQWKELSRMTEIEKFILSLEESNEL